MPETRLDTQRLRRLLDLGRTLVAELDIETLLTAILESARELTGARYAALGVLDEAKTELERFETLGIDAETRQEIGDLPRGRGVLGMLITDPRPLRLADVSAHPESYGFPIGHPPMRSFLGVPIVIRGEPWGNIYVTDATTKDAFDEVDEQTLVVLANWAATAIENARLYSAEAERRGELEQSVRALEATVEIARAVAGETRIERILELIAKRGRALVAADGILILLADGDELVVTVVAGALGQESGGPARPDRGIGDGPGADLAAAPAAVRRRPEPSVLARRRDQGVDRAARAHDVPRTGGRSARRVRSSRRRQPSSRARTSG